VLLQQVLVDQYAPLTGVSERTVRLYEYTIKSWSRLLGRQPTVGDLSELPVAQFLAARVRSKSPATAAKDRAQIRAMWDFCARRNLCATWPSLPRIVVPERVPEAWLTDEMNKILVSASSEPGAICGFPAANVWRALILLAYDTGERITPITTLLCGDVRDNCVIFRAESRKGRRRDVMREIGRECSRALQAVRRGAGDTAIPWDRPRTCLWRLFGRILRRAGLPADRRSKFHRIRKTTASFYEAAGGSAQRLLDHSSPAVTKRYLDPRIVRTASAPSLIPPLGAG